MNNKIDVLNLEWTSYPSRDREAATLVCNYLRFRGLEVYEGSMFNGFFLIDALKPKILFVTNSVGALLNLDIVKYAKSRGIICVSGISEGNFNENGISQFVWGVNKDKKYYEDRVYFWSEYAYRIAVENFPSIKRNVGVSGAVGFDRYKIVGKEAVEKPDVLSEFDYVLGVGCWNFDFLSKESHCYKMFNGLVLCEQDFNFFCEDRCRFNEELFNFAKKNPKVGILLKEHPGTTGRDWASGIEGLRDLSNVCVVKNELSVMQAISMSDLWLTYESTTALEAWLLDVPTCLLNPSGIDFNFREGFHLGQENYVCEEALSVAVSRHKNTGFFPEREKYSKARQDIIHRIVGYSDGLNHVRLGNEIYELRRNVDRPEDEANDFDGFKWKKLKRMLVWFLVRTLKLNFLERGASRISKWDDVEVRRFSDKRMDQIKKFYQEKGYTKEYLCEIKAFFPKDGV